MVPPPTDPVLLISVAKIGRIILSRGPGDVPKGRGRIFFGVIAGTPKSFRPTEDRVMQGRKGGDSQCDREEQDTSNET